MIKKIIFAKIGKSDDDDDVTFISCQGYDFAFMRRSHVYDECKNQTRHKWNTQYVGGNKLAVCNGKDLHNSATCFCAVFSCDTELCPFSIPRSVFSDFRHQYSVFSSRPGLLDNHEQQPAARWRTQSLYRWAEGSRCRRKAAARVSCVWTDMSRGGNLLSCAMSAEIYKLHQALL